MPKSSLHCLVFSGLLVLGFGLANHSPASAALPPSCDTFDYATTLQVKGALKQADFIDKAGNSCLHRTLLTFQTYIGQDLEPLLPAIEGLIQSGTPINAQNAEKQTALHIAAKGSEYGAFHAPLIERLLALGAKPDLKDAEGNTPLHNFLNALSPVVGMQQSGDFQAIAQALLTTANLNQGNRHGITPLMLAAGNGQPELVKLLLEKGATVNLTDSAGKNALDHAASGFDLEGLQKVSGHYCSARLLLQAKIYVHTGAIRPDDRYYLNRKCLN